MFQTKVVEKIKHSEYVMLVIIVFFFNGKNGYANMLHVTLHAHTDMRRLMTGIRTEKCVIRQFRRCANVIECTYTKLDSTDMRRLMRGIRTEKCVVR